MESVGGGLERRSSSGNLDRMESEKGLSSTTMPEDLRAAKGIFYTEQSQFFL